MKKGQRPGQHYRRVKTKRGRKKVTINRGRKRVSFKTPSKLPEGISKAQAKKLLDESFDEIEGHLGRGHTVAVPRFGIFKVKKVKAKPARMGRNPFTGETVRLKAKPASRKVKFFPSKDLKEEVL